MPHGCNCEPTSRRRLQPADFRGSPVPDQLTPSAMVVYPDVTLVRHVHTLAGHNPVGRIQSIQATAWGLTSYYCLR